MKKIRLLDSYVFNRIAAGEVVERPASVVKETVENSIDAGATNVVISITGGGIRQIEIVDNGCGIDEEDIATAFLPHATSKINKVEDLDNIQTYGFRGEALASISSVAKIRIKSKTADSDKAVVCEVINGEIAEKSYAAGNTGTELTVSNLFYNTPARAKFLKKEKLEENAVTQTVIRLMIANPNVAFDYYADGKLIHSVGGVGLEDCIKSIFGVALFDQLIPFSAKRKGVEVVGYISKPTYFKNNKNYQVTVLNSRVIVNQTITTAIYRGYGSTLMKGAHPLFFVHITADGDKLDVNVTPNKSDVRFEDSDSIFSALYHFTVDALEYDRVRESEKLYAELNGGNKREESEAEQNKSKELENYFKKFTFDEPDAPVIKSDISETLHSPKPMIPNDLKEQATLALRSFEAFPENESVDKTNNVAPWISGVNEREIEKVSFVAPEPPKENKQEALTESADGDISHNGESFLGTEQNYKIIGQIFDSFVIIESGDSLYFIDEHAAVERLNYDKLIDNMKNGNGDTQMLLFSEIVELDAEEAYAFSEIEPVLCNMGFEFQDFGDRRIKINGIPSILTGMNCDRFLHSVLSDVKAEELSLENILHDKIAQKACKASVRAGTALNDSEIAVLMKYLLSDGQIPLQCPHGRPTMFKFTKAEIEKKFRRI